MDKNKQATKAMILRMRTLTPRQWQKARVVLDMSKDEIMNDELMLFVVMAWHKDGADLGKFDDYMDKTEEELQEILDFDVEAQRELLVKALDELNDADDDEAPAPEAPVENDGQ